MNNNLFEVDQNRFDGHKLQNYRDSVAIKYYKKSNFPNVNMLISKLLNEVGVELDMKTKEGKKYYRAFGTVVCNLLMSIRFGIIWIGYSCDNNKFRTVRDGKRFNLYTSANVWMQVEHLKDAIKRLLKKGYLLYKKGFFDRRIGVGYSSRFLPSRKFFEASLSEAVDYKRLFEIIEDDSDANIDKDAYRVIFRAPSEIIKTFPNGKLKIIKNKCELEPFKLTENDKKQFDRLDKMNRLHIKHYLSLGMNDEEKDHIFASRRISIPQKMDMRVKQVFNNCSTASYSARTSAGGRFYNPRQNLKAECREFFIIDGFKTIEYDYGCLHPTMLYGLTKTPLPAGDLYEVGYPKEEHDAFKLNTGFELRKLLKQMLNRMINCKTRNSFSRDVLSKLKQNNSKITATQEEHLQKWLPDMLLRLEAKHASLKEYFYKGGVVNGRNLMNYDKDLSYKIQMRLLKKGIGVFGLHDSFLVGEQYGDLLKQIMIEVFMDAFPESGIVPIVEQKTFGDKRQYDLDVEDEPEFDEFGLTG